MDSYNHPNLLCNHKIVNDVTRDKRKSKKSPTKIKSTLRLLSKTFGIPYTQLERTVLGYPFGKVIKKSKGTSSKKSKANLYLLK